MQKKQKALLDEANKRIIATEAAATDLTAFATGVVQSSKNSIDSLYKSTQGFHKKYGAGIEQEAKQATKYNELLRENKTVTDELKKAKKEISQLKSKIEGMKDKKAQMLLEIKDLKSKNKSSRSSAAHAKSPGTIAKEKHELKMIEMKKRAEVKQQMKERDREHDNDVRNERVNMMSRFSLDSMRGDGKFVSIIVCSLYFAHAQHISNVYCNCFRSLAPLTIGGGAGAGAGSHPIVTALLPFPRSILSRVLPHTRGTPARRSMPTGGIGVGAGTVTGGTPKGGVSVRGRRSMRGVPD